MTSITWTPRTSIYTTKEVIVYNALVENSGG